MAIFPNLELEKKLQVNDKTRLDASKSFVSKGEAAISLVEIEPEAAAGFVDVTGLEAADRFLDWEYATDGTKTVSIRVTTDGAPVTSTKTIEVVTVVADKLFSLDADLIMIESDVLKYVRPGRNSFLDYHRRAQERILAYLDENAYVDRDGNKLTLASILDVSEFAEWSKFLVLSFVFRDFSNSIDDVLDQKSRFYEGRAVTSRGKLRYRMDLDLDGTIGDNEELIHDGPRLIRR